MNILFLCTGNSCRSQMAEAWGTSMDHPKYNFFSAGTDPQKINPYAVQVMSEVGIDISQNKSKKYDQLTEDIDIIFTVCGDAKESCPVIQGPRIIHVGFDDPPTLTKDLNDQEQILQVFRRVRDEIKSFVTTIDQYVGGDI